MDKRCMSEGQIVTLRVRGSPVAFHCSEERKFLMSPMHSCGCHPKDQNLASSHSEMYCLSSAG